MIYVTILYLDLDNNLSQGKFNRLKMKQTQSNEHKDSTDPTSFHITLENNNIQKNQEKAEKQNNPIPITLSWENISVFTASSKTGIKKLLCFKKEAASKQILKNGNVLYNRIFFSVDKF